MRDKPTMRGRAALVALLLSCVLPACSDPAGIVNGIADFEAAWSAVDSVYPFMEFKQIDWDDVGAAYRSSAEEADGNAIKSKFIWTK